MYQKIIAKIERNTAAVLGAIADNFLLFRKNLDVRAFGKGVNDHNAVGFGERQSKLRGALGRSDFNLRVVVGEINAVIMRFYHLGFVAKTSFGVRLP